MIYDMCRKFADEELAPNAGEWDKKHQFPADAIAQLGELGLMGINTPESMGGVGLDALSYAIVMEEISRGDASVGVIMSAHNSLYLSPIIKIGTPEQHEKWVVRSLLVERYFFIILLDKADTPFLHRLHILAVLNP